MKNSVQSNFARSHISSDRVRSGYEIKSQTAAHKNPYIIDCDTYQSSQLINQPTRITQRSSSIDLFSTNNPQNFSESPILIGLSDHCLVRAIRKTCVPKSYPKLVTSRCFKNLIPKIFRDDLINSLLASG